MSNGEKRRGLWIDPRTKILLLLLCVLSATMAPSLLYEMLVVALVACFGIVCGKVRYSIIGVIVYGGFYLLTQAVLQMPSGNVQVMLIAFLGLVHIAVMLRYVPTIREDWHFIKDAMRMRDVSPNLKNFILHPAMTIECIYVPLMMAASKTADELTVASVTRGIENPTQRTSYVRIGFGIADLIVVLAFLAMFLVGQFYGEVF